MTVRASRWRSPARLLTALGLLLVASGTAAQAQTWQCHARSGAFAAHDVALPEGATQFSGEMMIRKASWRGKWYPTAKVVFTDRELATSECHCNGVIATWYPDHPESFLLSLSVDGAKVPLGFVPYDRPITFRLTFAYNGSLKLEAAGKAVTGRSATLTRNNLHMSCSTANVDFNVNVAQPTEDRSPARCPYAAQEQWPAADIDRYCKVR